MKPLSYFSTWKKCLKQFKYFNKSPILCNHILLILTRAQLPQINFTYFCEAMKTNRHIIFRKNKTVKFTIIGFKYT